MARGTLVKGKRATPAAGHVGKWGQWFVWTGEHRAPRKGEWYRSGAIPEAYEATTDGITIEYDILRPAAVKARCPHCMLPTEVQ